MDWTPEEIKKLVKKFGGVAVMAEIMRVTPQTVYAMVCGIKRPSTGSGIAILNLIQILNETLSDPELEKVIIRLRSENIKAPIRARAKKTT